jgi:hypothetical protein
MWIYSLRGPIEKVELLKFRIDTFVDRCNLNRNAINMKIYSFLLAAAALLPSTLAYDIPLAGIEWDVPKAVSHI